MNSNNYSAADETVSKKLFKSVYEARLVFTEKKVEPRKLNLATTAVDLISEIRNKHIADGTIDPTVETVIVLALDRKNYLLSWHILTVGNNTSCLLGPREVMRYLCLQNACAFIITHNHPSGDPSPSAADINVTRQLREAAKAMDIQFQDHIVTGECSCDPSAKGFYSFREAGLI